MTSRRPILLVLALAAAAPAAASAADARYEATASTVAEEHWTYQKSGYPNRCRDWVQATGTVRSRVVGTGTFLLSGGGGYYAGGLSRTAQHRMSVRRAIDYRVHRADATSACLPCGPLSEYGPCGDASPPDDVGSADCEPAAFTTGRIVVTLVVEGTLTTSPFAPTEKILRDCPHGPAGVPLGTPEPKLLTQVFRGAGRALLALGRGQEKKFRRKSTDGNGCGTAGRKLEMRSCTTYETVVRIRRVEDKQE